LLESLFAARVDNESPSILSELTGKRQTQSTGSTCNKSIFPFLPLKSYLVCELLHKTYKSRSGSANAVRSASLKAA
jgi:hypothetical protein